MTFLISSSATKIDCAVVRTSRFVELGILVMVV